MAVDEELDGIVVPIRIVFVSLGIGKMCVFELVSGDGVGRTVTLFPSSLLGISFV